MQKEFSFDKREAAFLLLQMQAIKHLLNAKQAPVGHRSYLMKPNTNEKTHQSPKNKTPTATIYAELTVQVLYPS